MFHNTVNATQPELQLFSQQAEKLETVVLSFFKEKKGSWFNPPYVHKIVRSRTGKDIPLTSVRRAISDLTRDGKLEKSATAESKGIYGVKNYCWTLKV